MKLFAKQTEHTLSHQWQQVLKESESGLIEPVIGEIEIAAAPDAEPIRIMEFGEDLEAEGPLYCRARRTSATILLSLQVPMD